MNTHTLGLIALNISTSTYMVRFLPQLIHNLKHKKTEYLSFLMHLILIISFSTDLLYGFGRHMQWQYRMVTVTCLIFLLVQHVQFGLYKNSESLTLKKYMLSTALIVVFLFITVTCLFFKNSFSPSFFIHMGLVSQAAYFFNTMPQILKNYKHQTTMGMSLSYVGLAVFLSLLDIFCAYCLHWDYPSKIGPMFELAVDAVLVLQIFKYSRISTELATTV
jgi:uncharacterized protein with PQ loop repeat